MAKTGGVSFLFFQSPDGSDDADAIVETEILLPKESFFLDMDIKYTDNGVMKLVCANDCGQVLVSQFPVASLIHDYDNRNREAFVCGGFSLDGSFLCRLFVC